MLKNRSVYSTYYNSQSFFKVPMYICALSYRFLTKDKTNLEKYQVSNAKQLLGNIELDEISKKYRLHSLLNLYRATLYC